MTKFTDAIQHTRPSWPAVLLFTALLAQAPHAAAVFIRIAPHDAQWEIVTSFVGAWVYAVALEGATAYFVWRSKMRWAIIFALFSIAHNIAYYMPGAWSVTVYGATLEVRYIFSALLISASLPIAIAAFSHVQASGAPAQPTPPDDARNDAPDAAPDAAQPVTVRGELHVASLLPAPPDARIAADADTDAPAPAPRTRAMQLRSEGYTPSEIAKMLDAKYSTVQSWLRRASVQTNGGTQL